MSKTAWILKDNRVGSLTQSVALAKGLQLNFEYRELVYNSLARLPNCLLFGQMHVDKNKSSSLQAPFPDVIISASRRAAPLSLSIKRASKGAVKTIHIMRPECSDHNFDYIILPKHDHYKATANTIFVTGALNMAAQNIATCQPLKDDFVGIIIGGSTRNCNFSQLDAHALLSNVELFLHITKLKPIISFSARTPAYVKDLFNSTFAGQLIYEPAAGGINIYYSILKSAQYLICTADSISMCSEAVSSGKPVYCYVPIDLNGSKRHTLFLQQLVAMKMVQILDNSVKIKRYSYKPLNEVARIAELIKL
jgi:mitochondrial fission protein ELM1